MKPTYIFLTLLCTISLAAQNEFITKWQTSADNESITIPTFSGVDLYNYSVDWGDGNTLTGQIGDATHTYTKAGTYTVKITGDFPRIYFNGDAVSKDKIIDITQWGNQIWSSMANAFKGCSKLKMTANDTPDLSNNDTMRSMFEGATSFNGDLSKWDVTSISDMDKMFSSVTLSTANYNAMLDAWSKQSVKSFVNFDGGNSKYCTSGETGKNALKTKNIWNIFDGGKDSDANCTTLSIGTHNPAPWQLSPNPTQSVLHISGDTAVEHATIYALTGQQLLQVSGNTILSLENLRPGIYLVELINKDKDKTQVFKIVKE
ncbi:MAG: BspA family leucine-rich repeat surface protein [Bacteroidetes bacterium]|nr:BspA family leucine-rich repeat surface protein [Bacteroidota bacterium]MDA0888739.1 BspA family leucine-rich repeat surface protein [Bacteroidota bacterium]MDA1084262.1 BspA family leucine-rich repeat surface protein [Bacteroidota bacterium]